LLAKVEFVVAPERTSPAQVFFDVLSEHLSGFRGLWFGRFSGGQPVFDVLYHFICFEMIDFHAVFSDYSDQFTDWEGVNMGGIAEPLERVLILIPVGVLANDEVPD